MTAEMHFAPNPNTQPSRLERALNVFHYQPTQEEIRWGLSSSIRSEGSAGVINRALAKVFRQEEADVVGFAAVIFK